MLDIEIDSKVGILFVRLSGDLTKMTRKQFDKDVFLLIKNVGIKNIVINIQNLTSIDEDGIKILKRCFYLCKTNNGKCFICVKDKNKLLDEFDSYVIFDELSATYLVNS